MHIPWLEWRIEQRGISARTGLDYSHCFAPGAAGIRPSMNLLARMVLLNIVQPQIKGGLT